jgi:excisionase family DNA binding protein
MEPVQTDSRVVVVTVDELTRIVAAEVRRALAENTTAQTAPSDWLTPDQLAGELGYDRRTIPALVRRRGLPCHRIGRKLRFRRAEVDAWVKSNGTTT